MRSKFAPCLVALTLAACATPAERAASLADEAGQMLVLYGPACERLGYLRNTDPWRSCIVQFSVRESQRYATPYYGPYYAPWYPGMGWYR